MNVKSALRTGDDWKHRKLCVAELSRQKRIYLNFERRPELEGSLQAAPVKDLFFTAGRVGRSWMVA